MFAPNRIFSMHRIATGKTEWYFQAREGNIGPYPTKSQAELMLEKFIQTCIELGYAGGRKWEHPNSPAAVKIRHILQYELKADLHWA